ncbi:type II toxin-antitoxin system PemK/MazF family toxin [Methanoregula sp.]|uniref:type II toxin-antitoxin system PemK/MazF family toxin n=1 Tax=Methanoregula sp. TaxID=2052170 RepID=UPI003BB2200B
MPYPDLMEGDVFFLDLTDHTGISTNTMKGPHRIAVVMNPRKLANPGHKTIVCVPIESAHTNLWDSMNNRPRLQSHHCLASRKYAELQHDSLAKCEQIYTLNREFFTDYRFTIDAIDLKEIRRRMVNIIGYGDF